MSGSPVLAPPKGPLSRGGDENVQIVAPLRFLHVFPGRDIQVVFKMLVWPVGHMNTAHCVKWFSIWAPWILYTNSLRSGSPIILLLLILG